MESHNRCRETEYASCYGNSTPIHAMRLVPGGMTSRHASDACPNPAIRFAQPHPRPLVPLDSRGSSTGGTWVRGRAVWPARRPPSRRFVSEPSTDHTVAKCQNETRILEFGHCQGGAREAVAEAAMRPAAGGVMTRREWRASPFLRSPGSGPSDPGHPHRVPCMKRTSAARSRCWAD